MPMTRRTASPGSPARRRPPAQEPVEQRRREVDPAAALVADVAEHHAPGLRIGALDLLLQAPLAHAAAEVDEPVATGVAEPVPLVPARQERRPRRISAGS